MTILSDFLRNTARILHQNRARVIKWTLIALACLIAALLIYAGIERLQRWSYEKGVRAKEAEFKALDDKAKAAEGRAELMRQALEVRYAQQYELEKRAVAAEAKLKNTRQNVITLKEQYETVKYIPLPSAPISCAGICSELTAAGYPCK